ncbi:hypothetical protein KO561_14510 [Radiobacillus kanasensis]|uniref:hypothetical protein n=1 Tax=Radiobacillus kanasensis TaxID=2844358 RepID=UPI001E48F147|nr:hypothetical protein [Radiobacillus kanasensis]UFT98404.1 hypothetical protein KO561_14510 [Radiobacillus kanasensis]
MNELLIISIMLFIFLTFQHYRVLKKKEVPKGNKILAWILYGFSLIGISLILWFSL